MHPARFVTLLFAYAGVLTLLQVPLYDYGLDFQGVARAALGVTFLATAAIRLRSPEEESRPGSTARRPTCSLACVSRTPRSRSHR